MPVDKLTKTKCKSLGDGKHSDGRGLYFFVRGDSRIWTLRYTDKMTGRRGEVSLGSYPAVSLADARIRRDERIGALKSGRPRVAKQRSPTLRAFVGRWLAKNRHDLKDNGRLGRWLSPLRVHVLPVLGQMDVREITKEDIVGVIQPIWRTKPVAAAKAMHRLTMVLKLVEAELPEVDVRIPPRARNLVSSATKLRLYRRCRGPRFRPSTLRWVRPRQNWRCAC